MHLRVRNHKQFGQAHVNVKKIVPVHYVHQSKIEIHTRNVTANYKFNNPL